MLFISGCFVMNPGEKIRLKLVIDNWTALTFPKLDVTLSTEDPFVKRPSGKSCYSKRNGYRTVAPGRTELSTGFYFTVVPDCPDDYGICFDVQFESGSRIWTETFSLTVSDLRRNSLRLPPKWSIIRGYS